MEEYSMETEINAIKEEFNINQRNKNYKLMIILNSNDITLNIAERVKFEQSYEINLNLEQIKEKHIIFSKFYSLEEFQNYIKNKIENKEVIVNKISDNTIKFEFEKDSIFFKLIKKKINIEKLVENINITMENYDAKISNIITNYNIIFQKNKNMENEIEEIKKYNEILIEEKKKFKEEIKKIKKIKSSLEDINNEVQNIINILIEKDEIKKKEENILNQKMLELINDIENIKKDKEKATKKNDELVFEAFEISIKKIKNDKSRNNSRDYEKRNDKMINVNNKNKIEKINKIKQFDKYYEKKNDELDDYSSEEEKSLFSMKIKNKNKNNDYSRNKGKSCNIKPSLNSFENEINKYNNKTMNIKKNPFQAIKNYNNEQEQYNMLKTKDSFYKKKENLLIEEKPKSIDKINRISYNFNKNNEKNSNIIYKKIYKKQILKNNMNNINKIKNNIDEKFDYSNRSSKSTGKKISNYKFKNLQSGIIFNNNYDAIIGEDRGNNNRFNFRKEGKELLRYNKP